MDFRKEFEQVVKEEEDERRKQISYVPPPLAIALQSRPSQNHGALFRTNEKAAVNHEGIILEETKKSARGGKFEDLSSRTNESNKFQEQKSGESTDSVLNFDDIKN
eukprot:c21889_g1_i1.p1 GENE.c21889_g1_i1~~c21889_g1_i1.p1  ORF type:complete len:119 (-),score=56.82 c21889_g1_i1:27-344(-)